MGFQSYRAFGGFNRGLFVWGRVWVWVPRINVLNETFSTKLVSENFERSVLCFRPCSFNFIVLLLCPLLKRKRGR